MKDKLGMIEYENIRYYSLQDYFNQTNEKGEIVNMLKIKDNIDLSDLKKYRFKKVDNYYFRLKLDDNIYYGTIYVDCDTREIFAYDDFYEEKIILQEEWIEDLIKDDLLYSVK